MRAIHVTRLDGPDAVEVVDVPMPETPDGEALIDVRAAGVTFPDVLETRGLYQLKPDLPFVPGTEVAGRVRFAPKGSGLRTGDRVAAFCMLGGFAETVAVDPRRVFPLPHDVSYAAGAGLPMNALTVHFALTERARLREGETVLVHGAAGGVGTAAVQLAKALGARVIAVTSTPEKGEVARGAGADEVVAADGFLAAVTELTGGRGVDVVVDPVGGDRFTDSLRSLGPGGRLLVIGFTGGDIPTVRVNRLLLNNISVVGVGWGAWWMTDPTYLQRQWAELLPLIKDGKLTPVAGTSYPLEQAAAALAELEERRAEGKVLVIP
jgi:NADPH2:quinone reductase